MTLAEIKSDIDFLCDSNSSTYTDTDKERNINIRYQETAALIWESAGDWQYDDSNATDFGIATTTLVADQADYELPATCQRVQRVEIKDGDGNYQVLKQVDIQEIPLSTTEYHSISSTPLQYDIVGRSIFLYPKPGTGYVTLAEGLKIYFDRDVTNLSTSTDSPGFATAYHRILSLGAAIDFSKDENDVRKWSIQKAALEQGLKNFYAKRNIEGSVSIAPKNRKSWRRYT